MSDSVYLGTGVTRVDSAMAHAIMQSLGVIVNDRKQQLRQDSGETAAFARSLEHIYAQTYDKLYPEYKARQLLPLNTSVPAGAEQHTFRQFDRKGEAKIVRDYAKDFPSVELQGDEFRLPIVSIGASYNYSMQDVRASALMNLPLEARKALFARQVIEQKLDILAAVGDASTSLTGLANAPNIINGGTTTYGTAATTNWVTNASTSVSATLNDINNIQQQIFKASLGLFQPDTMLCPTAVYAALATTQAITPTGIFLSVSVLQYILDTSPWLKRIVHWPALDKAVTGLTHDRTLLLKLDPMVCELVIPQDFEQMPPELHGMKFSVACHLRCGGVKVPYPFAIAYYDLANG